MTTLTINQEEDEQRQLKVTVDVAEDRVQKAMRQKARQLGREIHVPGFRPGKAPYHVVLRRVGKDVLRIEAVEDILDDVFSETLEEIDARAYAQPTMDDMELEPLRVFFTIPLEPVVDLGDYREIRHVMEPVEITEEAVEDALEHIRKHHETTEPVDRPAEMGDLVTFTGTARYLDDEGEEHLLWDDQRFEDILEPESFFPDTPFVEYLLGMDTGDNKEFSLTFPEDDGGEDAIDENIAGREVTFDITILDVQFRELPELDDELAKLEGDYETLDELRASLFEKLEKEAQDQVQSDFFETMVDDMLDRAEMVYPPAALKAELDDMEEAMRNQVTQVGWEWDDYLRMQGQNEDDLRESWQEQAENRLRRNLVLINFIRNEKIEIDEERRDQAIEERLANYEDEELRESMREFLSGEYGFAAIGNELLMDMIIERMQAIGNGTAPDLAELELSVEHEPDEGSDDQEVLDEDAPDFDDVINEEEATVEEEGILTSIFGSPGEEVSSIEVSSIEVSETEVSGPEGSEVETIEEDIDLEDVVEDFEVAAEKDA